MERSPHPADSITEGLHRLMGDLHVSTFDATAGLGHVLCGKSRLARFASDRVEYRDVDVRVLLQRYPFEGVIWLLLSGDLPSDEELADATSVFCDGTQVERMASDAIAGLPLGTRPLELFPLAISLLACCDPIPVDNHPSALRSQVWRLLGQLPRLLESGLRSCSSDVVAGNADTDADQPPSFAAYLLSILRDSDERHPVQPAEEAAMNAVLTCQCLTELRPACFAARFFGSTVRDLTPSLGAAASLYVAQMRNDPYQWIAEKMHSFLSPSDAESWLRERISGTLPCGFSEEPGEPRSEILREHAHQLLGCKDRIRLAACAERLERYMATSGMYPTMDWRTAVVLSLLDVRPDRMSLAVAMARLAGWAAQAMEQQSSGVSLMPRLQYAV